VVAETAARRPLNGWRSWLPAPGPVVCLIVALGLVICAYAQDRSRETLAPNPWIFWAGIILIVAPITYRATALGVSSRERMLLVGLEGFAIYLARMMRDPYGFSFTDDFPHALSLHYILSTHHLYHPDVLLPIVAHYPGLEGAASAIATLTGMSTFGTGVLFVGACRVAVMVGLYVLYTRVSRSARVGALSALLFAANSNFMYFETQFAYETLSLPLLALALAALAERQCSPRPAEIRAWGIVVAVTIIAIVPTHHLTSYVLILILWLMCLKRVWLPRWLGGPRTFAPGPPVWPFALLATTFALAWLAVVASQTVGYVSPDIINAFISAFRTVTGGDSARALFSGGGTGPGTQNLLSEEAVSLIEPVVLLVVGALGVRRVWRSRHLEPIVAIFTVMAGLFFFLTALRVVPSAWEVGNRGAEFMFIGIGFMVGASTLLRPRLWERRLFRAGVALTCALCVVGAAVAGVAADIRLAHPTLFTASDHRRVYSETEAVGRWFAHQPPGSVLADDAESMTINLYGHHLTYGGTAEDADNILSLPRPYPFEVATVRKAHIRYVVVDLRQRSQDPLTGLYLNMIPPAAPLDTTFSRGVLTVWRSQGAVVYDSGNVIVFDLDRRP
jgi:hypothetical protein